MRKPPARSRPNPASGCDGCTGCCSRDRRMSTIGAPAGPSPFPLDRLISRHAYPVRHDLGRPCHRPNPRRGGDRRDRPGVPPRTHRGGGARMRSARRRGVRGCRILPRPSPPWTISSIRWPGRGDATAMPGGRAFITETRAACARCRDHTVRHRLGRTGHRPCHLARTGHRAAGADAGRALTAIRCTQGALGALAWGIGSTDAETRAGNRNAAGQTAPDRCE